MPRHAHGLPLLRTGPSRPPKRKPRRDAALNALETAELQNPDSTKIRQHRLGEVEDDSDVPETRADADERSSKRRKVTNQREQREDIEEGSDLEGGTWHTGVVDEDEDSDLDSEEAFGESDEEKFADFTFRGSETTQSESKSKKVRKVKELDLAEDFENDGDSWDHEEDQGSDGLGDDAVDLAAAWDMDDADQRDRNATKLQQGRKKSSNKQQDFPGSEDSGGISDDESSTGNDFDDDEENSSQLSVSEDELPGDTAGLRTFVENLSSSRDSVARQTDRGPRSLPSKLSQFGLPPSKLSATDLLQYVKDPTQRRSLKILERAEHSGPEEYKGGIPGKLSAPLAKRQQDRLDRGAAYEKSKETLNKWVDTVKQNRRAEHLSFPLVDPAKESMSGQKQLAPTNQSVPVTGLEIAINEIMKESGMGNAPGQDTEDQELAFEELAEKKMDIDEVKARRAELRTARELMFREEIRAKRIKKIKSKAFRRVHRKEKDRFAAQQHEALATAGLLNSDEEREKQDRRRAEERMGARHRESKWAKGIKQAGRATWDEDARAGVSDLARKDEELRRRIMGKDVVDSDSLDESSEPDDDNGYATAGSDGNLQRLTGRLDALDASSKAGNQSKLGQMAFMQRAEAARKAENDEEIRQLRLAIDDNTVGEEAAEDEYQEPMGRQKFGVQSRSKNVRKQREPINEFEARLSEGEDGVDDGIVELSEALPTSTRPSDNLLQQTKSRVNGLTKPREAGVRSSNAQGKSRAVEQVPVRRPQTSEMTLHEYTSSSGSDDDVPVRVKSDEHKAELAASIFAGPDDIVQDFAKEKAELVQEEGDQIIDNTLPGWGSWTGSGISKREQKKGKGRFLTTIKGVAADKRKDAKLERVIVNEKRIKKNGKYLATELPHPFETRQQYERSLRLPIGPEWSTAKHYQDSIKPRVLVKQGTVIRPIAKPIA